MSATRAVRLVQRMSPSVAFGCAYFDLSVPNGTPERGRTMARPTEVATITAHPNEAAGLRSVAEHLVWSKEILDELRRSVIARLPDADIDGRIADMIEAFPEASVTGYEPLGGEPHQRSCRPPRAGSGDRLLALGSSGPRQARPNRPSNSLLVSSADRSSETPSTTSSNRACLARRISSMRSSIVATLRYA